MFFTRFEETPETNETTPEQRLAILKAKIKEKRESLVQNTESPVQHPTKRRKLSGTEDLAKTKKRKKVAAEISEKEDSSLACRKKEKKKKREAVEVVEFNDNAKVSPTSLGKKKKKKKKQVVDVAEQIVENHNEDSASLKNTKKKKAIEVCESGAEPLVIESSEKVHSKKKKKKKKHKKAQEELEDTADYSQGAENTPEIISQEAKNVELPKKKRKKQKAEKSDIKENALPIKDTAETAEETVANNIPNEETPNEESMEITGENTPKPEEWTILGKHKTLQKVKNVKRDLPEWISHCETIDPENVCSVSEFGLLDSSLVKILESINIRSLFPVQCHVIPEVLAGCQKGTLLTRHFTPPSDVVISAPTGSGKTLVYVLSLVQCLYKLAPSLQAIVVLPTKNLANQVKQVFNSFSSLIKVALLSGKDTFPSEQRHLYTEEGTCLTHVAVCTPGRLVNHIRENKHLSFQHLRFLVIDEMDSLLNQSYQDWLPSLYKLVYNSNPTTHPMQPIVRTQRHAPSSNTQLSIAQLSQPALPLQKLLFSATVTHDPAKLAPLQLYKPKLFSSGGKYNLPSTLLQYQIRCELENKALVLIHLVKKLKHVLCFTSSVETSHRLALLTEEFGGIKVAEYSSSLTVQQRNKVVRDFSLGNLQLLVCSDSLARGMDISLVSHVINYDVPAHVQTYVHRVGRTARAGREGRAYTLVRYQEIRHFHQLLKKAGDARAEEMSVGEEDIEALSEGYQECLERLETRLKTKGKK